MKKIALLAVLSGFTVGAMLITGCVGDKAAALTQTTPPEPAASDQDTEIVDAWHDYNNFQLTDLSLIVMPHADVERDQEGRPVIETNGDFGSSRIFRFGHRLQDPLGLAKPVSDRRKRVKEAIGEETAAVALMFGAKMNPLTLTSIAPVPWRDYRNTFHFEGAVEKGEADLTAQLAKKTLETEKPQIGSTKLFRYQTRIVRLTEKACLNCHIGSRVGDPAAIMVYGLGDPNEILVEHNRLTKSGTGYKMPGRNSGR